MDKRMDIRGKKKKERKKGILIITLAIVLVMIPTFIFIDYKISGNKNLVEAKPEEKVPEATIPEPQEEVPKLDNSGYILLEDDINADDVKVVSENINGLLRGKKTFPVREDGKKVVYLTFDDGPSTTVTPKVLEVLDNYNVKATFFVLGTSIAANDESKEILKDIAGSGHAIGNHTYGHDYKYLYPGRTMNVNNIVADIEKNNQLMRDVLGQDFSTSTIRFPGGYWSWNGREAMRETMDEVGYHNVDWNALNGDSEGKKKDKDGLLNKLKSSVEEQGPNADSIVVLMHDTYGKEATLEALPEIIEYFQGMGFEFRTMK